MVVSVLLTGGATAAPPAVAPGPAATPGGEPLVDAGASWRIEHHLEPTAARGLATAALAASDLARGLASAPAPARDDGWPVALPDGRDGALPLGSVTRAGAPCACATAIERDATQRVQRARALTTFQLTPAHADVALLELRLRYPGAMIVWINGVEVARRNLPPRGSPGEGGAAERLHGPEWETVAVPVAPGVLRLGANQLALEVRPYGDSQDVLLDATLTARRTPRVVLGPMVQRVTGDAATIVVETDLPSEATIEVGPAGAARTWTSARARRHEFALTDLRPGAQRYQVALDGVALPAAELHPLPGPTEPLRLAIYGDVRGGHAVHAELVAAIMREAPDAVLATGDMVLRGSDLGDWQRFFAVTAPMLASVPLYPAIGNHDLGRAGADRRRAIDWFALPPAPPGRPEGTYWYSVDLGGEASGRGAVHVALLDSNAYQRPEQAAWLDDDLGAARARGARALIVVTHDGPFSRGSHRGNALAVRTIQPVLARHRVTLLAAGHDHLYQRGIVDGVRYVVSGGGGAPLYDVSCGSRGKRACAPDGMAFVARAHHIVVLTISATTAELCARKADSSLLEPCTVFSL